MAAPYCWAKRRDSLMGGHGGPPVQVLLASMSVMEHLFSYGTLQDEAVQLATFGRRLVGEPDTLVGYRQTLVEIRDPRLIAELGKYHINVQWTGSDSDSVAGISFEVSGKELEQADVYEADADYKRVDVQLKSGTRAWVYVGVEAS